MGFKDRTLTTGALRIMEQMANFDLNFIPVFVVIEACRVFPASLQTSRLFLYDKVELRNSFPSSTLLRSSPIDTQWVSVRMRHPGHQETMEINTLGQSTLTTLNIA